MTAFIESDSINSMEEMQFSITINAPRNRVWATLWNKNSFKQWAGLIDPGTYMQGDLKKDKAVQFISAENGYGVTSLVKDLRDNEYLLLKHQSDTKEKGAAQRDDEWTGGQESYSLTEQDGITTLTVTFDTPAKMKDYFANQYPKVMKKIKTLAEASA